MCSWYYLTKSFESIVPDLILEAQALTVSLVAIIAHYIIPKGMIDIVQLWASTRRWALSSSVQLCMRRIMSSCAKITNTNCTTGTIAIAII